MLLYIWHFHGRRRVQESPVSITWSLFFNLVEFSSEQLRILYVLNAFSPNELILLVLLVFKVAK